MSKDLPSDVRAEILSFLDEEREEERTFASEELGYAVTARKHGDEIRLSCPKHWTADFVEHFDAKDGFIHVDGRGLTAHEEIVRAALKTDVNGFMTRRERFALLDEEDRLLLVPDAQRLRVVLLSIATARASEGKNVAVYSTFPGSVVCMDLLEAAEGLGTRFSEITHAPLDVQTETGHVRTVEVPDTTTQQTPAKGRGIEADVHIYRDAGHQSYKQVRETALPAKMSADVEIVAGTARPLAHNRPPTGAQAALNIADQPRLYWTHA